MVQHFKSTWDEKEYKAVKRDVQAFRQDMMLLKQWQDDVDAMKTGQDVGVLHVDSKGLQADLHGTLNKALDVLKQLLTMAARKQCLEVRLPSIPVRSSHPPEWPSLSRPAPPPYHHLARARETS